MVEFIIGFMAFAFVGFPLLVYLIQTIRKERMIKKKDLYSSWTTGVVFLVVIIIRICNGAGLSSINIWDIYFIALAIVETIMYKKQDQQQ